MRANVKEPLYYAIMRLFTDGKQRCAADVVEELEPLYGAYKLLTEKDVDEALATAKENGLLDEADYSIRSGELVVSYRVNDFGLDMILKYL